ncbi:ribonuclease Y [Candidatus Uhrbacteria bacterium CG10_big_fil_rev_8_21_14_0_10_48_11]|uniref:Ribonuclease Y n=1 Tax=Candidatus Uhrbacteria bacterium CG10_big_fil_rev_8_21_14_0_10_48_11 TaxID=1975037 RepID=A0A2M8LFW7_9BACT|nr:MAG: ribonuclease Y [Candidatus Uhrbacteria bacterium CG10_big_fil_rev_8_21_14_0_10_48_11]
MSFTIISLFIGAAVGFGIGYVVRQVLGARTVNSAETKAQEIITSAKREEQEAILAAKQESIKIIDEAKREISNERQEVKEQSKRLEKRESLFEAKLLDVDAKEKKLDAVKTSLEEKETKLATEQQEVTKRLESVAGLNREQATEQLLATVESEAKEAIVARIRKLQDEGAAEIEEKAKRVLAMVIQRCAISHAADTMTTTVDLPSDDMKGRIIGKEGRNIKALEQLTGVEIIVDDTPGSVMISGFNLVRRHLAKRAIERLMLDGRIHPTRIEEAVLEAKRELALEMKKAGEEAMYQLGITGIDPKLVQILGRLKFRTSFGQNVLQHSIEVGTLSGLLAEELGADVTVCKKGGLFHDIGKAVDHEVQGAHTELGYRLMKKYGLPEKIAYMAIAHHEDRPETVEGVIVRTADAISGSRPGARRDTVERYIQRLEEIEKVATSLPGVTKAYAIQAGREVRVFVTPTEVDDLSMVKLAQQIARTIESELNYPGAIKVNCIRETRVIEYAR